MAARVRTTVPPLLFSTLLLAGCFLGGCARSVEERTRAEKKINASHRRALNLAKPERDDPYWQAAYAAVQKEPSLAQTAVDRSPGAPMPKFVRGSHLEKELLLTFDDGPHPSSTPELLKILREENTPATFFVIGKMAKKRPDLVLAIQQAGQTIGNHTYSHVTLNRLSQEEQRTEYRANNDIVRKITGQEMRFCRPPGGDYDAATIRAAQAEGLTTVLWTDDPGDFANPGDGIVLDRTLKRLSNGGILLMHDGSRNTIDTLRALIHEAKARGYTFVTPQQMLDGLRHPPLPPVVAHDDRNKQLAER